MKRKNHKVMILMTMVSLLAAMTVFAPQVMAMEHIWSKRFGGTLGDFGNSVATDTSGNVLVTGAFYGTVDFGGGNLTSVFRNIFLAKYAPNGNHLWSKRFGDGGGEDGTGVTTDTSGNVLVTGNFDSTVDFGGGNLTSAGGSNDIFLAKFDANGNHLWSKCFGGTNIDNLRSVSKHRHLREYSGDRIFLGHHEFRRCKSDQRRGLGHLSCQI